MTQSKRTLTVAILTALVSALGGSAMSAQAATTAGLVLGVVKLLGR